MRPQRAGKAACLTLPSFSNGGVPPRAVGWLTRHLVAKKRMKCRPSLESSL